MTEDIFEAIEADASAFDKLTTKSSSQLSELIRQLGEIQRELAKSEEEVRHAKERVAHYLHTLIPEKMHEGGVDKVEADGNTVALTVIVNGTMPKDPIEHDFALAHLRDIGASDVIKNVVSVSFRMKDDNRAKDLYAELLAGGYGPIFKTWVEPSTVKKLLREGYEGKPAYKDLDYELFNASMRTFAKITGTGKGEGT